MKKLLLCALIASSCVNAAIPAPTNYALQQELSKPLNQPIYDNKSPKLNLNFTEAPLRFVLQAVSEHLKKGIVLSEGVQGLITLNLIEVSAEEALDLILAQKGLTKVDRGSTYLITSTQDFSFNEALTSLTIKLNHARTGELKTFFSSNSNLLSPKGSIFYDDRSNSIVLNDTQTSVLKIKSIIESIDIPLNQVQIEARIVQLSTTFGKDLGVSYGVNLKSPKSSLISSLNGSLTDFSNFGFSFVSGSFDLDLKLDALQKEGLAKVISTPKILTLDNAEAIVSSGSQIPYQTSSVSNGTTSVSTEFKDALLSLSVTPSISPDGKILMQISITNDSLQGYAKNGEAILSKNQLKTKVSVEDGATVVLGGVFIDSNSSQESKVPFLSSIKFIKPLFSNTSTSQDQKELLIFLTPKVK